MRCTRYGYILEQGRVVMDGDAVSLRDNKGVKEFYLGLSTAGRKSYRDVAQQAPQTLAGVKNDGKKR